MKALIGTLAKLIKGDPEGHKQLRKFIANGSTEFVVITLSNGKKYKISTRSPKERAV